MKAFRRQWVEELYVKILEVIYKKSTATIKLHKVNDKIPMQKGVRQGDTISPKLFTAGLEEVFQQFGMREVRKSDKWRISKYSSIC